MLGDEFQLAISLLMQADIVTTVEDLLTHRASLGQHRGFGLEHRGGAA